MIKSKRLILRKLLIEDITDTYIDWLNNPDITEYLEIRFRSWDRKSVEEFVDQHQHHYGIFYNRLLIGTLTFNGVNNHHKSTSISFVIGCPGMSGKGFATEAVQAATKYMFELGFMKIYGGYYAGHIASERVFAKSGYSIEGKLKGKLVNYKGERVDHVYMGILNADNCM